MKHEFITHLCAVIQEAAHAPFTLREAGVLRGGSISRALRLCGAQGVSYFLKLNAAQYLPMFAAEADGLRALAATHTLRVPAPLAYGSFGEECYLLLEYLDLRQQGDAQLLGAQLAALHRCSAATFGYAHDNHIGSTPQPNTWHVDWITFWREQRLGHQLNLAAQDGHGQEFQRLGACLLEALPTFFEGYAPVPSLLHGDLWGGNHGYLTDGSPVLFDPAVYFGDRECDLAMSELFGGYPADFYAGYRSAWPLHAGYARRRDLYNLYHVMNHAHLFGGAYVSQATQLMRELLDSRPRS